jgi:hypothetical protein
MAGTSITAAGFPIAWTGPKADIRMSHAEKAAYEQAIENDDEISVRRRTHLKRYFTEFCENDDFHRRLNERQFKNEGKLNDGQGGKATIWTFKAWQWRVYGAIVTVNGRRCFVGVKIDPDKKQDRADRDMLKATAKIIGSLAEYRSK